MVIMEALVGRGPKQLQCLMPVALVANASYLHKSHMEIKPMMLQQLPKMHLKTTKTLLTLPFLRL